MKSLAWARNDLLGRIRHDLWRYLTPAADIETNILEAAALLQMRPVEVRTLGGLQFLASNELGHLLDYMPFLLRRLATTTTHEEEVSAERIRGSIQWGRTLGLRYASGVPHLFVTAPARRAYQTPENEMLVLVLDATVRLGREVGWTVAAGEGVGALIADRVSQATRWLQSRMLLEIQRRPVASREIARIRSGRFKRRYGPVIDAFDKYSTLVQRLDRSSVRRAIETQGLASRDDPTVFEIYSTFEVIDALKKLGWSLSRLGLFAGSLRVFGKRESAQLELTYQRPPPALTRKSRYGAVQRFHGLSVGVLRPDLVLRLKEPTGERWTLVEVKGGHRPIEDSARAATIDLLAYRRAFSDLLPETQHAYGLGIAWGAELSPSADSEIVLASPDTLVPALKICGF